MRILFLSRWYPYPPDNGSRNRILNLLQQLSRRYEVALVTFADTDRLDASRAALGQYCSSVRTVPYADYRPYSGRALRGLTSSAPRSLVDTYSTEMAQAVHDELEGHTCAVVIASELAMAPYAMGLGSIPAVLDDLELSSFLPSAAGAASPLRRIRLLPTWWKLTRYLQHLLPRFSACTVVSELEREHLQLAVPAFERVAVVPNAVDLTRYKGNFGTPVDDRLVFAGALTYEANHDAVVHFINDIYPRIRSVLPNVRLIVTGRTEPLTGALLPRSEGVTYTGYVDDIRPEIAESWASVVPLRKGGGTRVKILESMALGTPVVSTPKGAEGLDVVPGQHILLAEHPDEFARHVVDLCQSPGLRRRLAENGSQLVSSRYDWNSVGEQILAVVERAAQEPALSRES